MNELKDLYKIVKLPARLSVTGKDVYSVVRTYYNTGLNGVQPNTDIITVADNMLKTDAENKLKEIKSTHYEN